MGDHPWRTFDDRLASLPPPERVRGRVTRTTLAAVLRRAILDGVLTADERLPSVINLGRRFGCTGPTAQQALRILAAERLVYRVPNGPAYVRGALDGR